MELPGGIEPPASCLPSTRASFCTSTAWSDRRESNPLFLGWKPRAFPSGPDRITPCLLARLNAHPCGRITASFWWRSRESTRVLAAGQDRFTGGLRLPTSSTPRWSGRRDSNPRWQIGNLPCFRLHHYRPMCLLRAVGCQTATPSLASSASSSGRPYSPSREQLADPDGGRTGTRTQVVGFGDRPLGRWLTLPHARQDSA